MTFLWQFTLAAGISVAASIVQAEGFSKARQAALDGILASTEQQERYEKLDNQHQQALTEWVNLQIQLGQQQKYVRYMQSLVQSQQAELVAQSEERSNIRELEQSLLPLMMDMVDGLAELIAADQPLLQEERQQRVNSLQQMMTRADVTNAEKLRRIVQAYNIELAYGQQIEQESRVIRTAEGEVQVSVINLGRLALIATTSGYQRAWLWQEGNWQPLDADYGKSLLRLEAIRNQQAVPEMLALPLPAQAQLSAESN